VQRFKWIAQRLAHVDAARIAVLQQRREIAEHAARARLRAAVRALAYRAAAPDDPIGKIGWKRLVHGTGTVSKSASVNSRAITSRRIS
jgi:hypothetical protein